MQTDSDGTEKRSNMVKKASKVGETAFFSYFWGEISVMYAMKNCLSAIIAFFAVVRDADVSQSAGAGACDAL